MPKNPKNGPETPAPEKPDWLKKVSVALEYVSPETADRWLKQSPDFNRGIGKAVVFRYANAMAENRWFFTGEPVIFDSGEPNAELLQDGWHRLTAIVNSGKGQWIVIVRGVPREAFHYIDHGKGRVFRDTLTVEGVPHAQYLASTTSYIAGYLKHRRFTTSGLEDHERWPVYDDNKVRLGALQDLYNKSLPLKGVPPGLLSAVHFVLAGKDEPMADEFMEWVILGDDLEADHPVAQFRAYVRRVATMDKKPVNLSVKYGSGLVKAWNLVRNDEKVAKFTIPAVTPEPI